MSEPYTVAVVVDPEFGHRLSSIAGEMPVWIADTPTNRPAVEHIWASDRSGPGAEGVTIFKVSSGESPDQSCARILGDVDLHHGQFSHDPPFGAVEVFGALLTPLLERALGKLGFKDIVPREGGFRAERSDAAA